MKQHHRNCGQSGLMFFAWYGRYTMKRTSMIILCTLTVCAVAQQQERERKRAPRKPPTYADVKYGDPEAMALDFWKA